LADAVEKFARKTGAVAAVVRGGPPEIDTCILRHQDLAMRSYGSHP
jgi:hypothetical protein